MHPHDQSFLAQPTFDPTTGRQVATRLLVQGPYGILRNRAALQVAADDAGRWRTLQIRLLPALASERDAMLRIVHVVDGAEFVAGDGDFHVAAPGDEACEQDGGGDEGEQENGATSGGHFVLRQMLVSGGPQSKKRTSPTRR